METGILEKRWKDLFKTANATVLVKEAFQTLSRAYSEKHRHYHTLQHVNACLLLLDEFVGDINDIFSLESAIWFHDIIYNPKRFDNEEKSAKSACLFLEAISLAPVKIEKINHLILLTQHPSNPVTSDEKYLIDIDLSILGAENELYDRYESWIRKEYEFVPTFLYKKGRKKVLSSFTESDNIYQTDYFRKRYESQARKNIDRALHKL